MKYTTNNMDILDWVEMKYNLFYKSIFETMAVINTFVTAGIRDHIAIYEHNPNYRNPIKAAINTPRKYADGYVSTDNLERAVENDENFNFHTCENNFKLLVGVNESNGRYVIEMECLGRTIALFRKNTLPLTKVKKIMAQLEYICSYTGENFKLSFSDDEIKNLLESIFDKSFTVDELKKSYENYLEFIERYKEELKELGIKPAIISTPD